LESPLQEEEVLTESISNKPVGVLTESTPATCDLAAACELTGSPPLHARSTVLPEVGLTGSPPSSPVKLIQTVDGPGELTASPPSISPSMPPLVDDAMDIGVPDFDVQSSLSQSGGSGYQFHHVYAAEEVSIPAHSCARVPCAQLSTEESGNSFLVELAQGGLTIFPILVPGGEDFAVCVFNETDHTVIVSACQILARSKLVDPLALADLSHPGLQSVSADSAVLPGHLVSLFDQSAKSLDDVQASALCEFLIEFQDVFSRDVTDLGLLKAAQHRIDTAGACPIKQPMSCTPLGFEGEEEQQYLHQMLRNGIICRSHSSWALPPVLVRKKDGSAFLVCTDHGSLIWLFRFKTARWIEELSQFDMTVLHSSPLSTALLHTSGTHDCCAVEGAHWEHFSA